MREIKKAEAWGKPMMQPGRWKAWGKSVMVSCPECGQMATLQHDIDSDGKVTPSLECPYQGCAFHDFVILADWEEAS